MLLTYNIPLKLIFSWQSLPPSPPIKTQILTESFMLYPGAECFLLLNRLCHITVQQQDTKISAEWINRALLFNQKWFECENSSKIFYLSFCQIECRLNILYICYNLRAWCVFLLVLAFVSLRLPPFTLPTAVVIVWVSTPVLTCADLLIRAWRIKTRRNRYTILVGQLADFGLCVGCDFQLNLGVAGLVTLASFCVCVSKALEKQPARLMLLRRKASSSTDGVQHVRLKT